MNIERAMMIIPKWERFIRTMASVSPLYVLMVLGLVVAIFFSKPYLAREEHINMESISQGHLILSSFLSIILWVVLIVAIGVLILSARFEYKRRTHDWKLIQIYQSMFDSIIATKRPKAAAFLLGDMKGACCDLDDILDIFEDLGFYLEGDQVSSEVVHHHFEHWIRIYCQKSEKYVKDIQKDEPLQWEHLESLLYAVSKIEMRKRGIKKIEQLRLSEETLKRRLEEELSDSNP
jgi:hypothetical protein